MLEKGLGYSEVGCSAVETGLLVPNKLKSLAVLTKQCGEVSAIVDRWRFILLSLDILGKLSSPLFTW